MGSDAGMNCRGIDILQALVSFVPMGMGSADVHAITGVTDRMRSASITGSPPPHPSSNMCSILDGTADNQPTTRRPSAPAVEN